FKMIEATNIKTIEEMIDSLENEKFRLPSKPLHAEEETSSPEIVEESFSDTSLHVNDHGLTPEILFSRLCDKLMDRNVELGECFKNHIRFENFSDHTLTLNSTAQDESGKILKNNSAIIRHFVQDTFGFETTINITKVETKPEEPELSLPSKEEVLIEEPQSASMIETIEFEQNPQSESCATGNLLADQKEYDATDVLKTPFIQRATELFEPKKIQIQQKV
ncbi:MAG: DNA polymerase III subunit gamma/tau, partial [Sulfurospirillum sp.]|nr:DNA polymerase III subunit gamma/tau [Sulfurospirillum sp.]